MSKPDLKVFLKATDGSGYVDLVAYWRSESGMLRGAFDRDIAEIAIKRRDGSIVRIKPDEKGRSDAYYINAREESQQQTSPRRTPTRSQVDHAKTPSSKGAVPDDDFVDDDFPF